MKKNDVYEIEITGYTSEGEGTGRVLSFVVFVPFSCVGDVLKVRILKVKKTYAYGKIEEIISKGASRIEPCCKSFAKCGGCHMQHISYEEELSFKTEKVYNAFKKIANIDILPEKIIGSLNIKNYRNKAQFPVGIDNYDPICGFYAKNSHNIIKIENCEIQNEHTNKINNAVLSYMKSYNILPYDEATHFGVVRHIYSRATKNEIMVVIVTNTKKLPYVDKLIENLLSLDINIVSIMQNINDKKTNVVQGSEFKTLWGKNEISDHIGNLRFDISPQAFYQVNSMQTEKMYNKVLEFANLTGKETVFDLYCGIGTITLFLSKFAKKTYGIEIVNEAVLNARHNAQINNINNATFYAGLAEDVTQKLYSDGVYADVVVVDPPRSGCDIKLLNTIITMKPQKIVYVSCDVATLARDVKILSQNGFAVKKVQPIDMFPRTFHVECVVMLQRKDTL